MKWNSPISGTTRRAVLVLTASLAASGFAASACAQEAYPAKAVKVMVGFSAGAATDLIARYYAKELSAKLGQAFIVENLTGNGGNTAISALAKARPDGYTIALGANYIAVNAAMNRNPYNWETELIAVAPVASITNLLVVPATSPIKSVADLVAEAKRHDDAPLTFGSAGTGTSMHMAGELFKARTKVKLQHVPYRGAGAAELDLVSGRIDLLFDNIATALPLVNAGKLRALAVTSMDRSASVPEVPTVHEAGIPNFNVNGTFILMAPVGTSDAVVSKLNAAVREISASPSTVGYLRNLHAAPVIGSPDDGRKILASEYAKWSGVIQQLGLKFE